MLQSIGHRGGFKHPHDDMCNIKINLLSCSADYFILFSIYFCLDTNHNKQGRVHWQLEGVAGWETLSKLKLLPDNQIFLLKKNTNSEDPSITAWERRGRSLCNRCGPTAKTSSCFLVNKFDPSFWSNLLPYIVAGYQRLVSSRMSLYWMGVWYEEATRSAKRRVKWRSCQLFHLKIQG